VSWDIYRLSPCDSVGKIVSAVNTSMTHKITMDVLFVKPLLPNK
jgi:hypothetical protein